MSASVSARQANVYKVGDQQMQRRVRRRTISWCGQHVRISVLGSGVLYQICHEPFPVALHTVAYEVFGTNGGMSECRQSANSNVGLPGFVE